MNRSIFSLARYVIGEGGGPKREVSKEGLCRIACAG
jgi:hypothetical protein